MSPFDASVLLRPGLLEGMSMVLASASKGEAHAQGSLSDAVRSASIGLGARVYGCELRLDAAADHDQRAFATELAANDAVDAALADSGSVDLLVVDAAGMFAHVAAAAASGGTPGDAREALLACLEASWNITRAVASRAFLPGRGDGNGGAWEAEAVHGARGGRIVYLAPPNDSGEQADAALAGLENLARTLSIEWARHGITTVAVASGAAMANEVAALIAYLASVAGAYYSGCLLDIRGAGEKYPRPDVCSAA
jgi:NAD(P)-dependent dehydrogenase (short-subunit alcohol dehydrogenase family)